MGPEPSLDLAGCGSPQGLKRKAQAELERRAAGSPEKRRADGSAELRRLFGLDGGSSSVLVVGDGNLSFATALSADAAAAACNLRLLATAYEDAAAHAGAFGGDAAERTERLAAQGAQVAYGVDATRLACTLPEGSRGPFARIIFQFPQHPDRHKIHRHRELLIAFFASAVGVLELGGEIVVSLCKGQGGTPAELGRRRVKDTYQVQDAAAAAGLVLRAVRPCPVDELLALGYSCTGFRAHERVATSRAAVQLDRPFHLDGSLTHVFCREGAGRVAIHPLVWHHDVSFWISGGYREAAFEAICREVCGEGIAASLELLDEYDNPKDGRKARTYRIQMAAESRALSSQAASVLRDAIREKLFVMEGVQPRRRAGDDQKGALAPVSSTEVAST